MLSKKKDSVTGKKGEEASKSRIGSKKNEQKRRNTANDCWEKSLQSREEHLKRGPGGCESEKGNQPNVIEETEVDGEGHVPIQRLG